MVIPTGHHANIFGLQFIPQSGSSKLATGAMDHTVELHTIDAHPFSNSQNLGASSPRPTHARDRAHWVPGRGTNLRPQGQFIDLANEDEEEDEDSRGNSLIADVQTTHFNCHRGRIKEIQVQPEEPSLFWSVSEDGTVRQYDLRVPSSQQNRFESSNVLLAVQKRKRGAPSKRSSRRSSSEQQHQNNVAVAAAATITTAATGEPVVYRSFSRTQQDQFTSTTNLAELKSLSLNPLRPMQLAVAASDKYVRIYDRRQLSVGNFEYAGMAASSTSSTSNGGLPSTSFPAGLVTELMPPHIALGPLNLGGGGGGGGGGGADQTEDGHPTHISFSNSGDKLLATYHGNYAFMWSTPNLFAGAENSRDAHDAANLANVSFGGGSMPSPAGWNFKRRGLPSQAQKGRPCTHGTGPYNLPEAAEMHRLAANLALYDRKYIKALSSFNAALKIVPHSPVLLTGRALVFLSRGWIGDKVEALRDAEDALYYDFDNVVSHLRRAQALFDCGLLQSTEVALRLCRFICYDLANNSGRNFYSNRDEVNCEYEEEICVLERKLEEKMRTSHQRKVEKQWEGETAREARRRRGLNLHRRSPRFSGECSSQRNSSDNNNNTAAAAAAAEEEAMPPLAPTQSPVEEEEKEREEQSTYCSEEDEQIDIEVDKIEYGSNFLERVDKAFSETLEKEYRNIHGAGPSSSFSSPPSSSSSSSSSSWLWGALPSSSLYLQRFVGHCNLQTDIKEAVFLGQDDSFVAAGSDDGRIYLYDTSSGVCLRALVGDNDIVNCIRPHPHLPVLATSGIDSTIKLWSPSSTALMPDDVENCCAANQTTLAEGVRRMRGLNERLFEILTQHPGLFGQLNRRVRMDLRHGQQDTIDDEEDDEELEEEGADEQPPVQCRVV
jgi:WD40 repeat protein